jgi:hypothetical protein
MAMTFGLLVGAIGFRLACGLLGPGHLLRGLGFLGLRGALVAGASAAGVLLFSESMLILPFSFAASWLRS